MVACATKSISLQLGMCCCSNNRTENILYAIKMDQIIKNAARIPISTRLVYLYECAQCRKCILLLAYFLSASIFLCCEQCHLFLFTYDVSLSHTHTNSCVSTFRFRLSFQCCVLRIYYVYGYDVGCFHWNDILRSSITWNNDITKLIHGLLSWRKRHKWNWRFHLSHIQHLTGNYYMCCL